MPRAPEIVQFAEKLGVMLDRLGMSRVQLAQAAGVDKLPSAGRLAAPARVSRALSGGPP
jgi:hypothetical protein